MSGVSINAGNSQTRPHLPILKTVVLKASGPTILCSRRIVPQAGAESVGDCKEKGLTVIRIVITLSLVLFGALVSAAEPAAQDLEAKHLDNVRQVTFGPRAKFNLFTMEIEYDAATFKGGNVQQITDKKSADVLPVFSPDGKKLMWTSTRTADGTSQLWIADWLREK